MVRNLLVIIVLMAAAAHAGVGAVCGEVGLGLAGVAVGGVLPAGAVMYATDENAAAGIPFAVTGGAAAGLGVYLAGEWWGGRSADPAPSFLAALLGGEAAGVISAVSFGLAGRPDGGTDDNEGRWIPVGLVALFAGAPALATVGYNVVKEPAAGEKSSLTITPTVAALPPRAPGEPPTVTFGVAAAF